MTNEEAMAAILIGEEVLDLALAAEGYDAIGRVVQAEEMLGRPVAARMALPWVDRLIDALGLVRDSRMDLTIERDPGGPGPWNAHPAEPSEGKEFRSWWSAEMVSARLTKNDPRWAELLEMAEPNWTACMLELLQTCALTMRNADEYKQRMQERALAKVAARQKASRWN